MKTGNKYHAKKVVTEEGTFDSKLEHSRWLELCLLERAGKIRDLQRQVRFELIPSQWENYPRYGKRGIRLKDGQRCLERACDYVADFVYEDIEGQCVVVEDTKSKATKTEAFRIKRKLMLSVHGIKVKEISDGTDNKLPRVRKRGNRPQFSAK